MGGLIVLEVGLPPLFAADSTVNRSTEVNLLFRSFVLDAVVNAALFLISAKFFIY